MSNVDLEKKERGKSKSKRKMPGDFCRMSNVECRMSKLKAQSSNVKAQITLTPLALRSVSSRINLLSPVGIPLGGDERECPMSIVQCLKIYHPRWRRIALMETGAVDSAKSKSAFAYC